MRGGGECGCDEEVFVPEWGEERVLGVERGTWEPSLRGKL